MSKKKQKYYISFDPEKLIIWGCGVSEEQSIIDVTLELSKSGYRDIKLKTIPCSEFFFSEVREDGHWEDKIWAIVNGTPTFIHDDLFTENLKSKSFKKKTFTIERPK